MRELNVKSEADRNARKVQQKRAKWFIRIHRRLLKPPYPVLIHCPACGHGYIEVNADLIEIVNNAGLTKEELTPADIWTRQKHSCGATITLYWKA